MSDHEFYSLRALARKLKLPLSTVRYYRDVFGAYLPTAGQGRDRRYPPEALAVMRLIARGYARKLSREAIERSLSAHQPAEAVTVPVAVAHAELNGAMPLQRYDELVATMLDGERERREVLWQMAREIVRLGEAVERQHGILAEVARQFSDRSNRALPAALPAPADAAAEPAPSVIDIELSQEMEQIQQELQRERDLVERLRHSKLEIERRAAEAEARLSHTATGPRKGLLDRLLGKDD